MTRPEAEWSMDAPTVRRLLERQVPELGHHRPRLAGEGFDTQTWRVGHDRAVRLPRRHSAVSTLVTEQTWLPRLASRLTVAVPSPLYAGRPEPDVFPHPWSVVPWFDAEPAVATGITGEAGERLGAFLAALHQPSPEQAPDNPYRSVPLASRVSDVEGWRDRAVELLPGHRQVCDQALAVLRRAAALDPPAVRHWIHADLHPANLLVDDGTLAAVIDWGDLCGGDPALDLAVIWWFLDEPDQASFWGAYGTDTVMLRQRSQGWAVFFGLAWLLVEHDDRTAAAQATGLLQRVAAAGLGWS